MNCQEEWFKLAVEAIEQNNMSRLSELIVIMKRHDRENQQFAEDLKKLGSKEEFVSLKLLEVVYQGETLLGYACNIDNLQAVRLLVEAGANINQTFKKHNGYTTGALYIAASKGHLAVVAYLVDYLINKDDKELPLPDGTNALYAAAIHNQQSVLEYLLNKKKYNPDPVRFLSGNIPLLEAIFARYVEIVKCLILAGANIKHRNHWGVAAVDHSISDRSPEIQNTIKAVLVFEEFCETLRKPEVTETDGTKHLVYSPEGLALIQEELYKSFQLWPELASTRIWEIYQIPPNERMFSDSQLLLLEHCLLGILARNDTPASIINAVKSACIDVGLFKYGEDDEFAIVFLRAAPLTLIRTVLERAITIIAGSKALKGCMKGI